MVKPRKLPMEMRKTAKERSVSFTKRRQGLFSKAANFSMITDSQIALWVTSPCPNGKTYSFTTHHSVNEILDAFLQHRLPQPLNEAANSYAMSLWHDTNTLDTNSSFPRNENTESTATQRILEEFKSCNSVEILKDVVGRLESMKSRLISRIRNRVISQTLPTPSSTIQDVCSISLLNNHVGAEITGDESSIAGINYDIMPSSMPAFGFCQNVGEVNYNVHNGEDILLSYGFSEEDNAGGWSNVDFVQNQNQDLFHNQCYQIAELKHSDEDEKGVLAALDCELGCVKNDLMDNKWNEVEDGGGVMDSTWIQNLWSDEDDYEKDWKNFEGEFMGAVPFEFEEKPISDDWFSLPPLE